MPRLIGMLLLAAALLPLALPANDYDVQLKQNGLNISCGGLEIISFSRLIAVEPPWGKKYFFNAQDKLENSVENGKCVQKYRSENFELNHYSAEVDGDRVVVSLDARLLKEVPAFLEYCIALIPTDTLGAAKYRVFFADGGEKTGELSAEPPYASEPMFKDAVKVVFEGPFGTLTIESLDKIPFSASDARSCGAAWGEWYTVVKGVLLSGSYDLKCGKPFTGKFAFSFKMKPGCRFPTPLPPTGRAAENVALADIDGNFSETAGFIWPQPKQQTPQAGRYIPKSGMTEAAHGLENLPEIDRDRLGRAAEKISSGLAAGSESENGGGIFFTVSESAAGVPDNPEGYRLEVTPERVDVFARTPRGAFYALQTLRSTGGACGTVIDWPDIGARSCLVMVDKDSLRVQGEFIEKLYAPGKINTLFIECEYAAWDALEPIRQDWAMSKDDLRKLVAAAEDNYIEVVPLFQTLGHCEWLFKNGQNRDMAENPAKCNVYDVRNPKVHPLMEQVLNEVIDVFHPRMLHIGHDEIGAEHDYPVKPANVAEGGAKLIMDDIMFYHDFCKRNNLQMMIWHDMFIRTPRKPHGSFGLADARREFPRDIVFAFWNYGAEIDEPTIAELTADGFPVVLCGWDKRENIRNLTALAMKYRAAGYMTTTWAGYDRSESILDREFGQVAAYIAGAARAWNTAESANAFSAGNELSRLFFPELLKKDDFASGAMIDISPVANLNMDPAERPFGTSAIAGCERLPEFCEASGVKFMTAKRDGGFAAVTVKSPSNPVFPKTVTIPLNRKASGLHVLHAMLPLQMLTDNGSVAAEYVLHYADGSTSERIPVRYGFDIGMPWDDCSRELPLKRSLLLPGSADGSRIWFMTVRNPKPELEIASLELLGKGYPYYLFAVTAED
ncbi:MAG: family 20 glycosylhydrolase [Victivallaceae bacterium]|nr:family 20 glycosylhydrolase [Victivallaceae bacterium]